jgi:hypothetical protein
MLSEVKHLACAPFFVILNEVKDLGRVFYWRNAYDFFFAGRILRLRLRMTKGFASERHSSINW